jgi:hypothetical protein
MRKCRRDLALAAAVKACAQAREIRQIRGGRSPVCFAAEHGGKDHDELAYAIGERHLRVQTTLAQTCVELLDDWIGANRRQRRHVEYAPDLSASASYVTLTMLFAAVAIKRSNSYQSGNLLALGHPQLGQVREQSAREYIADCGHGAQQLIASALERSA